MRDPVCGMAIDPYEARAQASVDGVDYYFCSRGCRAEFLADATRAADAAGPGSR